MAPVGMIACDTLIVSSSRFKNAFWRSKLPSTISAMPYVVRGLAAPQTDHGRFQSRVLRPCDFDAVVEERAHNNLCGMPTCSKPLLTSDRIPKYRIRHAQRQVVHARPSALRHHCSSDCAALSTTYRATLSDLHIQYRDLIHDGQCLTLPTTAPTKIKVIEKTPVNHNQQPDSLSNPNSFSDILFELSRVARTDLQHEDHRSIISHQTVILPEPSDISPEECASTLSRFGRLFVWVSTWCKSRSQASSQVVEELRICVKRYGDAEYRELIDTELDILLDKLGDPDPLTDPHDYIAVSIAIISAYAMPRFYFRHVIMLHMSPSLCKVSIYVCVLIVCGWFRLGQYRRYDMSEMCNNRSCDHVSEECLNGIVTL